MKIPVYLCTCLTSARIASYRHSKMLRGPSYMRANGTDAKQSNCLPAQDSGFPPPPLHGLLCLHLLEDFLFMEQQIGKNIFRHQLTENAPRVCESIVASLCGIYKRLDSRINGLDPLEAGEVRQRIPNLLWFAEDDIALGWVR